VQTKQRFQEILGYKHNLPYFFDEKDMGIEHALLPEKGLVVSGDVIIGSRLSHMHPWSV